MVIDSDTTFPRKKRHCLNVATLASNCYFLLLPDITGCTHNHNDIPQAMASTADFARDPAELEEKNNRRQ